MVCKDKCKGLPGIMAVLCMEQSDHCNLCFCDDYGLPCNKNFVTSLIPGAFYTFIITTYILQAKIGFNLPLNVSYIIGGVLTVIYSILAYLAGVKKKGSEAVGTAQATGSAQQSISKK